MRKLPALVPLLALLLLGQAAPVARAGTAYVALGFAGAGPSAPPSPNALAVVDTATNQQVGGLIPTGNNPGPIAIAPDGTRVYVVNRSDGTVSVIDTATNAPAALPIAVGVRPTAIAITPDGRFAYVTRASDNRVVVIDTATNTLVPLSGGREGFGVRSSPGAIAIAPDGVLGYVANSGDNSVSVFSVANNVLRGVPDGEAIRVGANPTAITISPDGRRIYVANLRGESVSVIDAATHTVIAPPTGGTAIPVTGREPRAMAISRNGKRLYVARIGLEMAVINTVANVVANPIATAGGNAAAIAITADGSRAYLANEFDQTVGIIGLANEKDLRQPFSLGGKAPTGIAIAPDRSPVAAFAVPAEIRAGAPIALDASASTDPDAGGRVASYAWDFGDGQSQTLAAPAAPHTYAAPGTYTATLTVADEEGCSVARTLLFTGQAPMGCVGSPLATKSQTVTVLPPAGGSTGRPKEKGSPDRGAAGAPRVRLSCPKSAKPRGCSFKLQAVAKKPKRGKRPKFTSAVAKAKAKPGRSKLVPLVAKAAFRARLATAKTVLVRLDAKVGKSRKVGYRRLKVVR